MLFIALSINMSSDRLAKPSTLTHSLEESEQSPATPAKRFRIMNTPPAEPHEAYQGVFPLRGSHARPRLDTVPDNNREALAASWERLLLQLREEVNLVTQAGSDIIPSIHFGDLRY